jgi:hypothetical protein
LVYNDFIDNKSMNYLCLVDGLVEYSSTSLTDFAHYQLLYVEEHRDANVEYLTLTDDEFDSLFPVAEEELEELEQHYEWEECLNYSGDEECLNYSGDEE